MQKHKDALITPLPIIKAWRLRSSIAGKRYSGGRDSLIFIGVVDVQIQVGDLVIVSIRLLILQFRIQIICIFLIYIYIYIFHLLVYISNTDIHRSFGSMVDLRTIKFDVKTKIN